MISFIQESYSQIVLLVTPMAVTVAWHLWKSDKWHYIQICACASMLSTVIYVMGSTFTEGLSPFLSMIIQLSLAVQVPVSLATGGVMVILRRLGKRQIELR